MANEKLKGILSRSNPENPSKSSKMIGIGSNGRNDLQKRIPYGAYDSSNAKLITADSEYPKNYEHYSNFEPKKTQGILNGKPNDSYYMTHTYPRNI